MKNLLNFAVISSMLLSTAVFAANTYTKTITIINCTGKEITMSNDVPPYKFSLAPYSSAYNGFSPIASVTLSPKLVQSITISIYRNSYTDGAMHVILSGGVNGDISFSFET